MRLADMSGAMTALDIMVLLSVGIAAVFGLMRGFLVEIFSLAAWIAGVVAVKLFQPTAAAMLVGVVGTQGGAALLAVAVVFGVAFLAVRFIGRGLGKSARASVLGPVDRALGLGFGGMKGLIVATLAFLLMTLVFDTLNGVSAPRPGWMMRSRSYDLLRASSASLVAFVERERAQ